MEGEVIMADNTQMIGYQKTITATNRKIKKLEDEISELESMQRKMQSLQRQLDTSANAAFQKVSSISGKVRHGINMNFFSGRFFYETTKKIKRNLQLISQLPQNHQ